MADGAGKLDKLARLKNLKSGLKAKNESSRDDPEDLSLDAVFAKAADEEVAVPASSAVLPKPDAPPPSPAPKKGEQDAESLSAYFEALGIVPDGAKLAGARGMPPKPYAPPSDAYTNTTEEKGREVDIRDRWADPVREDDAFLSSFAGPAQPQEEQEEEEPLSLESIIGSFDEAEIETAPAEIETAPAEIETAPAEVESAVALPDELASIEVPLAEDLLAETLAELELELEPDALGKPVDIEAFEREIGLSAAVEPVVESEPVAPAADSGSDQPLSITFDETRATLLEHVSKQMNCSIDDVVVTAIDWYLDALFGEDDPEMKADAAE